MVIPAPPPPVKLARANLTSTGPGANLRGRADLTGGANLQMCIYRGQLDQYGRRRATFKQVYVWKNGGQLGEYGLGPTLQGGDR